MPYHIDCNLKAQSEGESTEEGENDVERNWRSVAVFC